MNNRFVSCPSSDKLSMKILLVCAKFQYGNPDQGIGTEYAAFIPALKNLGYEVIHFDSWHRSLYSNYAELNRKLLETVSREKPDVMLTIQRDYEIWIETLNLIKSKGDVATITWTTDDSWKYQEVSRFIGEAYHAITTTYPQIIPKYYQDNIHNVLLTQWAANSDSLEEPLLAASCQYQVSFVGAAHGNRKKTIAELQRHGIEVSCFGHGWPAGPVLAEEIPGIMRNSLISLNFSNSYKGANQIKARTFEVPGAGGFLITEYTPGIEKYYEISKEIVVFRNTLELANKIRYYLSNPEERDLIALNGFRRTIAEHTYEIRMKQVIEFAINCKNQWVQTNPVGNMIEFQPLEESHKMNVTLTTLKDLLVWLCVFVWGSQRGPRAARRIMFELSWRFFGSKTFTASGCVGRMFPEQ